MLAETEADHRRQLPRLSGQQRVQRGGAEVALRGLDATGQQLGGWPVAQLPHLVVRHQRQQGPFSLARAERRDGSWWLDWGGWLAARSGALVRPRQRLGSAAYPPLADAPGQYVLQP